MEQKTILDWSKLESLTNENIKGVKEKPGVFRISKKSSDGKFYVVYVGSAENLKQKIQSILSEPNDTPLLHLFINQGERVSFRYALIEDQEMRKAIEKQMYRHYAPICNLEEPESSLDIKVNLS